MIAIQGDRVLLHWTMADNSEESGDMVLTVVHVVDIDDRRELRLVNREDKTFSPDWPLSQKLLAAMQPCPTNAFNARWKLRAKL